MSRLAAFALGGTGAYVLTTSPEPTAVILRTLDTASSFLKSLADRTSHPSLPTSSSSQDAIVADLQRQIADLTMQITRLVSTRFSYHAPRDSWSWFWNLFGLTTMLAGGGFVYLKAPGLLPATKQHLTNMTDSLTTRLSALNDALQAKVRELQQLTHKTHGEVEQAREDIAVVKRGVNQLSTQLDTLHHMDKMHLFLMRSLMKAFGAALGALPNVPRHAVRELEVAQQYMAQVEGIEMHSGISGVLGDTGGQKEGLGRSVSGLGGLGGRGGVGVAAAAIVSAETTTSASSSLFGRGPPSDKPWWLDQHGDDEAQNTPPPPLPTLSSKFNNNPNPNPNPATSSSSISTMTARPPLASAPPLPDASLHQGGVTYSTRRTLASLLAKGGGFTSSLGG